MTWIINVWRFFRRNELSCYHARKRKDCRYFQERRCFCEDMHNARDYD